MGLIMGNGSLGVIYLSFVFHKTVTVCWFDFLPLQYEHVSTLVAMPAGVTQLGMADCAGQRISREFENEACR